MYNKLKKNAFSKKTYYRFTWLNVWNVWHCENVKKININTICTKKSNNAHVMFHLTLYCSCHISLSLSGTQSRVISLTLTSVLRNRVSFVVMSTRRAAFWMLRLRTLWRSTLLSQALYCDVRARLIRGFRLPTAAHIRVISEFTSTWIEVWNRTNFTVKHTSHKNYWR